MAQRSIVWFRQDLRISDNPALAAALARGDVLPVYILDDESAGDWRMGAASRAWLHHSLESLSGSLDGRLLFFSGSAERILPLLAEAFNIDNVFWNRCYEPWRIKRDQAIKSALQTAATTVESFNGSLLWEPWQILKKDATPYKVFTPYFRRGCLSKPAPRLPKPQEDPHSKLLSRAVIGRALAKLQAQDLRGGLDVAALELLPSIDWYTNMLSGWEIGEAAAHTKAQQFTDTPIQAYKERRDFPAEGYGSRLSPHLHFGEISPHQVWQYALQAPSMSDETNRDHFLSELGWREFSYYLLYHWPQIPDKPFNPKYESFPWLEDQQGLEAWQRGQTGYPIVDAGMRELWQTGFMHNRVRMIVASFLVKNQLIPWRAGEAWFWDCLVDADLAANSASWQWSAGCGADAAPYFRIFNPVTQSEKFDSEGIYISTYCPELAKLPKKFIHKPWAASPEVLAEADVQLGVDYPQPILDLKITRERALAANRSLRAEE